LLVVKPSVARVIFPSSNNKSLLSLFLGDDACIAAVDTSDRGRGVNGSPIDLFERLAM
jgi:hypothetical protein